MVLEGPGAIATVRTMMGATDPLNSAPGTIRGDLALELGENVVHGSDSASRPSARSRSISRRRIGVTSIAAALALGPIALASRSPQRRMILEQAGTCVHRGGVELPGGNSNRGSRPTRWFELHARGKALGWRHRPPPCWGWIRWSSSTAWSWESPPTVLKPRSSCAGCREARHRVHSGFTSPTASGRSSAVETTAVTFARVGRRRCGLVSRHGGVARARGRLRYPGSRSSLVTKVDGDYLNVVGLPLRALLRALTALSA